MGATIWMIAKYVAPSRDAKVGARGFLLLKEFVRQGHRAVLLTSDSNHVARTPTLSGPLLDEQLDGVTVRWLRTLKYASPSSLKRLLSWVDFEWRLWRMPHANLPRPDVVIVSSLSLFTIFTGLRLRRRYGCKLVFEVRDIWPLLLVAAGRLSPLHPLYMLLRFVERLAYRRADLIVGTMPNLGQHVTESAGPGKTVVCVPQGLEDSHLQTPQPLPDGYAEKYMPGDKFIVCYAGSIGADNALDTLVECARAMQENAQIHFVIVGDGYLKPAYMEKCAQLANVTFAPKVEKAMVPSVLERADVVYFAVHRSDALRFGQSLNKLIDYMASGKPVLASYSGYPSMVNEADCGIFVPAEDAAALRRAVEELAATPAPQREAMGARGRQWLLKNRTYAQLADDYLTALALKADVAQAAGCTAR